MIVPYARDVATGSAKRGAFWLPMGVMTEKFVDSTTGSSTLHQGQLEFKVSNAKEFAASDHAVQIVTDSILSAAPVGIKRSMISVTSITANSSRRLSEEEGDTRRLAGEALIVKYSILIPASTKFMANFSRESINTEKLTTAMTTHAQKAGLKNFKVHSVVVKPFKTSPNEGQTTTTRSEGTITGGASPVAGLSALIVAFMMLAGSQFFA